VEPVSRGRAEPAEALSGVEGKRVREVAATKDLRGAISLCSPKEGSPQCSSLLRLRPQTSIFRFISFRAAMSGERLRLLPSTLRLCWLTRRAA
jgi:hypothetical protein